MGGDLRDLYFGEALYYAYQGQYFEALQRLDTEVALYRGLDQPGLDTLHYHINEAEFSVGDFELTSCTSAQGVPSGGVEGAVDEPCEISCLQAGSYSLRRISSTMRCTRWADQGKCPKR
jgi:hypothetical protein